MWWKNTKINNRSINNGKKISYIQLYIYFYISMHQWVYRSSPIRHISITPRKNCMASSHHGGPVWSEVRTCGICGGRNDIYSCIYIFIFPWHQWVYSSSLIRHISIFPSDLVSLAKSHSANYSTFLEFEVLTEVIMLISIFWYITLCSALKVNKRFGWAFRLHLQSRISQTGNESESRAMDYRTLRPTRRNSFAQR
jgi:hypothetical protein